MSDDASLMLCLTSDEINAVAEALATVKLNVHAATDSISLFGEQREKATSGEEKGKVDDRLRQRLSATYASGFEALNVALEKFGREPVPRYEFKIVHDHAAPPG